MSRPLGMLPASLNPDRLPSFPKPTVPTGLVS